MDNALMTQDLRLSSDRFHLPLRAVRLQCLDERMQELVPDAVASGFLMIDRAGVTYLYTGWHVVTGFDSRDLQWMPLPPPPKRCFVRIDMQDSQQRNPSVTVIGGRQTIEVPLYAADGRSLWEQDYMHLPHADLNPQGLRVPFWIDAVRLRLPTGVRTSEVQVLQDPDDIALGTMLLPGEPVYMVGFPYGYSTQGLDSPTPIVLVRHVAAINPAGRALDFLLDGAGAEGMSGGPVFVQREQRLRLVGVYSGAIYPKRSIVRSRERDVATSLGICSALSIGIHNQFVPPDQSMPAH
jgi:hypothetical protein